MNFFSCYHVGILCIMSPCGVIVRCAELFCSESKTQVYAILHDMIRRNEKLFENLSKLCDPTIHERLFVIKQ